MQKRIPHVCVIALAAATCLCARPPATLPKPKPAPAFEMGPLNGVSDVSFSADGRTIFAVGYAKPAYFTYALWDIATGKSRRLITSPGNTQLYAPTFSPDRRILATGLGPGPTEGAYTYWVTLWDAATGKTIHKLAGHENAILGIAFSADGHAIAAGGQDDLLFAWDVATGKQLYEHSDNCYIESLAFSPDGKTLASICSADPSSSSTSAPNGTDIIEFRDAGTGTVLRSLPRQSNEYVDIAYSPDGNTFVYTSQDNTITLSDASTGQVIHTIVGAAPTGDTAFIGPIVFSPDGQTLAAGSDSYNIKLWSVSTGQLLQTLSGHSSSIQGIAFSAGGKTLVSGSDDNTIKLWDVSTGKLQKSFGTVNPASAYGPQP